MPIIVKLNRRAALLLGLCYPAVSDVAKAATIAWTLVDVQYPVFYSREMIGKRGRCVEEMQVTAALAISGPRTPAFTTKINDPGRRISWG